GGREGGIATFMVRGAGATFAVTPGWPLEGRSQHRRLCRQGGEPVFSGLEGRHDEGNHPLARQAIAPAAVVLQADELLTDSRGFCVEGHRSSCFQWVG